MCEAASVRAKLHAAYFPISFASVRLPQRSLVPAKAEPVTDRRMLPALTFRDIPRTIVTASSPNHKETLKALYGSIKRHEPRSKLVIFAMKFGEQELAELKTWPEADVRVFDFTKYPAFMDVGVERGQYAWKGMMLREVAREQGGLVLWLDAGDLIWADLNRNVWRELTAVGGYSTQTLNNIENWVHPTMMTYFNMPETLRSRPMCNGATFGFHMFDPKTVEHVALPYFDCMAKKECVAPEGTSRANHRQDQSALTVLFYMNDLGRLCEKWDNSRHIGSGVSPSVSDLLSSFTITMHNDQPGEGSKRCKDANGAEYDC